MNAHTSDNRPPRSQPLRAMDAIPTELHDELVRLILSRAGDDTLRTARTTSRVWRDLATAELERRAGPDKEPRLAQTTRGAMATRAALKASAMLENMGPSYAFKQACKYNVRMARSLYAKYASSISGLSQAFEGAVKHANKQTVRWMSSRFARDQLDASFWYGTLLIPSSSQGDKEMIQFLINEFGLYPEHTGIYFYHIEAIVHASVNGHLELAQELSDSLAGQERLHGHMMHHPEPWETIVTLGSVAAAKWAIREYEVSDAVIWDSGQNLFGGACKAGNLEVARWLVSNNIIDVSRLGNDLTLCRAVCINGHKCVIDWLLSLEGTPSINTIADDVNVLNQTCDRGHLEMAKWLAENAPVHTVTNSSMLDCAVSGGNLELVRWLTDTLGCRAGRWELYSRYVDACMCGDKTMANWMANEYGLNIGNACLDSRIEAMTHVVCDRDARTAEWVADAIEFRGRLWNKNLMGWLKTACAKGKLRTAQMLVDRYPNTLTKYYVTLSQYGSATREQMTLAHHSLCSEPLQIACERGHASTAKWLVERFDLATIEEEYRPARRSIRNSYCLAIKKAYTAGHQKLARWLTQRLRITPYDVYKLQTKIYYARIHTDKKQANENTYIAFPTPLCTRLPQLIRHAQSVAIVGILPEVLSYLAHRAARRSHRKRPLDVLPINSFIAQLVSVFRPPREDLQLIIQTAADLGMEIAAWLHRYA